MGHGRALINIEDTNTQLDIYEKILKDKLSVRETEALVRNFKDPEQQVSKGKQEAPAFASEGKSELSSFLESKVQIKVSGSGKGQFVIPFSDEADFRRILNKIKGER